MLFLRLTILLAIAAPLAPPVTAKAAEAPPPGVPACPSEQEKPDVAALVKRIERSLEGKTSVAMVSMSIKTKTWSRKLKMKMWSKGRDYFLVRVLEGGPRETGMMTLKREKQLWNWLPQAARIMKLPSGMLGDAWMGSDFTNDDLVKGNSMVDDFESVVTGTVKHDGRDAWQVVLIPKASATVVWGRIEMLVDRAACVPLVQRFYDEEGLLARTVTFSDLRAVGWRTFPARMGVKPEDTARETSLTYEEIQFDVAVPEETFSLHRLQQGR